jgi:hypothetical protein
MAQCLGLALWRRTLISQLPEPHALNLGEAVNPMQAADSDIESNPFVRSIDLSLIC